MYGSAKQDDPTKKHYRYSKLGGSAGMELQKCSYEDRSAR